MRPIPKGENFHLNPNDGMPGGYGQKKKSFARGNMHYISHNSVVPAYDLKEWVSSQPLYARSYGDPSTSFISANTNSPLKESAFRQLHQTPRSGNMKIFNTEEKVTSQKQPSPLHSPTDVLNGVPRINES